VGQLGEGLLQTGQRDLRQLDLRALSLSDAQRTEVWGRRARKGRLSLKLVVKENSSGAGGREAICLRTQIQSTPQMWT